MAFINHIGAQGVVVSCLSSFPYNNRRHQVGLGCKVLRTVPSHPFAVSTEMIAAKAPTPISRASDLMWAWMKWAAAAVPESLSPITTQQVR